MRRFPVLPFILAGALAAADPDPTAALRLPAGSPELAAAAAAWDWRRLRPHLEAGAGECRRGAARLVGALAEAPPPAELLDALACADADTVRLAEPALRRRLGEAPADRIAGLADPLTACLLLARHPAPDALGAGPVRARVASWLDDPRLCAHAAQLLVARGAADWGEDLVRRLASGDERVAESAHQALCALTRSQRRRDLYSGDVAMLQRDWRDQLARRAERAAIPAPEVAAAVAELPSPAALEVLLAAGPTALAAVERAAAGAPASRRRELGAAARLLARRVTPGLWRALGEPGLAGMDADDPRQRIASLNAAAAAILAAGDATSIPHLISYADDADPRVRSAAWDRILRLGDEKRRFGGWSIGSPAFPRDLMQPRLRASLARGGIDEQVAALQVAGALDAKDLADEVAALLLSPDPSVVETALDALKALHAIGKTAVTALVRFAGDGAQTALHRRRAIELLTDGEWSDKDRKAHAAAGTAELLGRLRDAEPPLGSAAWSGLITIAEKGRRSAVLADALRAPPAVRTAVLILVADRFCEEENVELIRQAIPFISDPSAEVASAAAAVLAKARDRKSLRRHWAGWFDAAARQRLSTPRSDEAAAAVAGIALGCGALDRAAALAVAQAAGAGPELWRPLAHAAPDAIAALLQLPGPGADGSLPPGIADPAIQRAIETICWMPAVAGPALARGRPGLLPSEDVEDDLANGLKRRSLRRTDGRSIILVAEQSAETGNDDREPGIPWRLAGSWPPAPDPAALADALRRLPLRPAEALRRDLALALLGAGDPPTPTSESLRADDDLWRLLMLHRPGVRSTVVEALAHLPAPDAWLIGRYREKGNPDLLPHTLASDDDNSNWQRGEVRAWAATLPPQALSAHASALTALPWLVSDPAVAARLRQAGPLPLATALALLPTGSTPSAIVPYGEEARTLLRPALERLGADQVLSLAPALRRLRSAGAAAFDAELPGLLAGDPLRAAAWMRSGIPLDAGLTAAYERALAGSQPDLWLVGAARALATGQLDAEAFLARARELPPRLAGQTILLVERRLADRLATSGPAVAALIDRCPAGVLPAWIRIAPADQEVLRTLALRRKDRATSLATDQAMRQRADGDQAWREAATRAGAWP